MFNPLTGKENDERIKKKYDQLDYDSDDDVVSSSLSYQQNVFTNRDWISPIGGKTEKQRKSQNNNKSRSRQNNSSTQFDPRPGTSKQLSSYRHKENDSSDDEIDDPINKSMKQNETDTIRSTNKKESVCQKSGPSNDLPEEIDLDLLSNDDNSNEKPKFRFTPSASKLPFQLSTIGEEPVIQVPATINQYLRDYQRDGIRFLYSNYKQGKGAILGDDMGLGKTVQVIGFIAALLRKQGNNIDIMRQKPKFIREMLDSKEILDELDSFCCKPFLIIAPGSVMYNWLDELETWGYFSVGKFHGNEKADCESKLRKGKYEVVVTTFDTFRDHVAIFNSLEWEAVVADEVHKIKGLNALTTQALRQINTNHRYGLTGTVLQNNMTELWSLLDWAQPGCLGNYTAFKEEFANPIEKGQKQSSTKSELAHARKMKARFSELRNEMLLRRTKKLISDQLPSKDDNVVYCKLTDLQIGAYRKILEHPAMSYIMNMDNPCACGSGIKQKSCCKADYEGKSVWSLNFTFMHLLLKVANHIALLIPDKKMLAQQSEFAEEICKLVCKSYPEYFSQTKEAAFRTLSNPQYCGKMKVLQGLLTVFYRDHSKVLLFSYSTRVLNIIEQYLMTTGYEYRRFDGKISMMKRMALVREFNKDPNIFIFIISTKAGGLGLNLTAANRVVIFDPNWNPTIDLQAQDRAYRLGQRRNVQVYRLISAGSIEENIYLRQIYKQQLDSVAVSSENARRYFSGTAGDKNDKGELFGIKNMYQLRTGDSCLTMDILKRSKRIEESLSNFKIEEYIPGTTAHDKEKADDSTGSESESTKSDSNDEDQHMYKELFDLHDLSGDDSVKIDDDHLSSDEESLRNKSPQKAVKIKSKESPQKETSSNYSMVRKYKKDVVQRHKNRKRKLMADRRADNCIPPSVETVFDQCDVLHVHKNRKIVGGSKAEDHMTRCAIQEVYELHQNLDVPAEQCDPLDESSSSSEDNLPMCRGRRQKSDHNTPRNTVIGNLNVLIGQTPNAIKRQHIQKMCTSEKCDSIIELAEKILRSTEKERMTMLKAYYTSQKQELAEVFEVKTEESRKNTTKTKAKPGVPKSSTSKVQMTKQKARNNQTLSFYNISDSESLETVPSRKGQYRLDSKEESLELGRKRKKFPTKGQTTTRLRNLGGGKGKGKRSNIEEFGSTSFVPEIFLGSGTDEESDAESKVDQVQNPEELIVEIGKQETNVNLLRGHSEHGGTNRKPENIDEIIDTNGDTNTVSRTSESLDTSVLDDIFRDNQRPFRKPPPGKKKRQVAQISGSTDLFTDESSSVRDESDLNKSLDCFNESTLKDDSNDCFSGPNKRKRKKKTAEDIANRLLSESNDDYMKLFESGKMKRISRSDQTNVEHDGTLEHSLTERTPSLF